MSYVLIAIGVLIAGLVVTIAIQRGSISSLKEKLSKSLETNIKLTESLSQKEDAIDGLITQSSRNEEINREYERRLNEINKMGVKDHVENLRSLY